LNSIRHILFTILVLGAIAAQNNTIFLSDNGDGTWNLDYDLESPVSGFQFDFVFENSLNCMSSFSQQECESNGGTWNADIQEIEPGIGNQTTEGFSLYNGALACTTDLNEISNTTAGGAASAAGFMVSASCPHNYPTDPAQSYHDCRAMGFSLMGGTIPAGNGTFITLESADQPWISMPIISDQNGAYLEVTILGQDVAGCTDDNACNYQEDATEDDGSCEYAEPNFDCGGNCIVALDCSGECGGDAAVDECGVCEGEGIADGACDCDGNVLDCSGECGGDLVLDECGVCDGNGLLEGACNCAGDTNCFDFEDESTGWAYNLSTIQAFYFVSNILVNGEASSPGDIVGAFRRAENGSLICVGYASAASGMITVMGNDGNPNTSLYLQSGNVPEFMIYDSLTGIVLPITYYGDLTAFDSYQSSSYDTFYADCTEPGALDINYTLTGNSIELSWEDPEGLDPISYFYNDEGSEQEVVSPFLIENLEWEAMKTFTIRSSNVCGNSFSQIEVQVGPAPLPDSILIESVVVNYNEVSIQWRSDANSLIYEVLRDSVVVSTQSETYFVDPMLLANNQYSYKVRGANITGNVSESWEDIAPNEVLTLAVPSVENIEVSSGDGRAFVSWEPPNPYGDISYSYQVFLDNAPVKETGLTSTYIPNLSSDTIYCLNVVATVYNPNDPEFLIGESDQIEFSNQENCVEPDPPLGTDLSWGIQVVSTVKEINSSNQYVDEYNMLGMAESASNEQDSQDIVEPPNNPNRPISFYFEPDWDLDGNHFTEETRQLSDLSDTTIVWDAKTISVDPIGDVSLTFYLIDNNGTFEDGDVNVPYLYYNFNCDPTNPEGVFTRIEDGFTYDVGLIVPGVEQCYQIVVGNAIPESPKNLTSTSGYREIMVSWEDGINENASSPQFSSTHYRVYRSGENTEKSFTTSDTYFVDRGLDPSALYSYKVAGINLAGEGPLSTSGDSLYVDGSNSQYVEGIDYNEDGVVTAEDACYSTGIACETTKENRRPSSRAGIDLVFFDMDDSGDEDVTFPVSFKATEFGGWSLIQDSNPSYDIDNYYVNNQHAVEAYSPALDSLGYEWTSAENEIVYTSPAVQTTLMSGERGFELKVKDNATSNPLTAIDSVFVLVDDKPYPPAITLDQVELVPGLYSIDINWSASSFTGESYADLNLNGLRDEGESYRDCGFDNLCSNDVGYIGPDFGEEDGVWNFEDLNGNGVWDGYLIDGLFESWIDSNLDGSYNKPEPFIDEQEDDGTFNGAYDAGLRPRPGYYGLPINNYPDKIASSYRVQRNGVQIAFIDSSSAPTMDGDLEEIFTFTDNDDLDGLDPSTQYCYTILSCHTLGEKCEESQEFCATTESRPSISLVSHNAPIILSSGELDTIEIDIFNPQFVKHVDIFVSYNGITWEQKVVNEDNIQNQYEVVFNTQDGYPINRNVKLKAKIIDIYDYDANSISSYEYISQSPFTISTTSLQKDFESSWHLFGAPLQPFNDNFQYNINNYFDVNYAYAYDGDLNLENLILESGEGYYLYLGSEASIQINGEVLSSYTINDLDAGWNLISNPLVVDINKDSLIVIYEGSDYYWHDAVEQQLVSGSLLGLNNETLTHENYDILEDFKGYWIHANEENLSLKVRPHFSTSNNSNKLDWQLDLFSRASVLGQDSFGDMISIGIDKDASNEFIYGEDDYHLATNPYINTFTKMYVDSNDGQENIEIYRDIRRMNQDVSFTWEVNGISNNVSGNIKLSWSADDVESLEQLINENAEGSAYSIVLAIGEEEYPYEMIGSNICNSDNWCTLTLTQSQYSNFKIKVMLNNYISGCMDGGATENGDGITACNYNPNANISDELSCTYLNCSGCTDNAFVNFDPSAVIDDGSCESSHSILVGYDLGKMEFNDPSENNSLQNIYINPEVQELQEIPVVLKKQNNEPIEVLSFSFIFDQDVFSFDHLEGDYSSAIELSGQVPDCYSVGHSGPFVVEEGSSMVKIGWYLAAWSCGDSPEQFINDPEDIVLGYFRGRVLNDQSLVGETTTITLLEASIDNEFPGIYSNSASYNIVDGLFNVEGLVSYYSNGIPVPGANLDLSGESEIDGEQRSYSTSSIGLDQPSSTGKYYFNDIFRGPEYVLAPSLKSNRDCFGFNSASGDPDCGINSADATIIARSFFEGTGFSSANDSLAANVTMDLWPEGHPDEGKQQITGFDASRVARFSILKIPSLQKSSQDLLVYVSEQGDTSMISTDVYWEQIAEGVGGKYFLELESSGELVPFDEYNTDWIFVPGDLSFPLIENLSYKNFTAIRLGDVDGSLEFINDNLMRSKGERLSYNVIPDGELIKVPVKLKGEYIIDNIDLHLNYNHDLLD